MDWRSCPWRRVKSLQDARKVLWRVRGAWLEIDTSNDGTFKTRLRVVAIDPANQRLIAESPSGKRSVWGYTSLRITVGVERQTRVQGIGNLSQTSNLDDILTKPNTTGRRHAAIQMGQVPPRNIAAGRIQFSLCNQPNSG